MHALRRCLSPHGALVLLVGLAACTGARSPASVLLRPEVPAARLQALRAEPSIPNWASGEEIVAVCEASADETLVFTTHRVLTVRDGWVRAPEVRIQGHETIQRQADGLRLVGRTAIGSSSGGFATGRCDVDAVEPLVASVIQLRREGGTAAALLAHHERIAARDRARAEAAGQHSARQVRAMGAPTVPGLTWADAPDFVAQRRALYEHFDVTPSDLSYFSRAYPDGLPEASCRGERIGRTCTATVSVPYGGSCRAAAVFYAANYYDNLGRDGGVRVECPEYTVTVSFSFGDVALQQFRDDTAELVYAERGPLSLLE